MTALCGQARAAVGAGLWLALAVPCAGPAAAGAPARWASLASPTLTRVGDATLIRKSVSAVATDHAGYLWLATQEGVARWDGYGARFYRAGPEPGALPDSYIVRIHVDPAGRIWSGSNAGALMVYDPATDGFARPPAGAFGSAITGIEDDGAGGLFVATGAEGVVQLDARGAVRRHLELGERDTFSLKRTADGGVWVGLAGAVARVDPAGGAPRRLALPGWCPARAQVTGMAEQAPDLVLVTDHCGAFRVRRAGADATLVPLLDAEGRWFQRDVFFAVSVGRHGDIWLGGNSGAIVLHAGGGVTRLRHDAADTYGLPNDTVNCFGRDGNGNLLLGTDLGAALYQGERLPVLTLRTDRPGTPLGGREVGAVASGPDGRVWLGAFIGTVDVVDPVSGAVGRAGPLEVGGHAPPVTAFAPGPEGMWVANETGLFLTDPRSLAARRVALPADRRFSPLSLAAAGEVLWAGGMGTGVLRLRPRDGGVLPPPSGTLTDGRVRALARGPDGAIWAGTFNGLNRIDPVSGAVERIAARPRDPDGLPSPYALSLLFEGRGRLWVGTQGGGIGVLAETRAGAPRRFRQIGAAEGLSNLNVDMLLADGRGGIWGSTDDGIALIDPDTLRVTMLHEADGATLPGYWAGAGAVTTAGELVFGGVGGISVVRPDRMETEATPPRAMVTAVEVGHRSVPPLLYNAAAPPVLIVPPAARGFAVEFSAAEYVAPERVRYAYRLEGFDTDWVERPATDRRAEYTNLPAGDYRLRVRAAGRTGAWGPARQVAVRVLPAWYERQPVRLAVGAAAVGAMAAMVQARTALLRARQRELERQVRARTADLERLAMVDPLTGIANRRQFMLRAELELEEARREAAPLGLMLLDLDRFKALNDRFGHAGGDAALRHAAQVIERAVAPGQLAARIGGEEFVVLAPRTGPAELLALAERLRMTLAAAPARHGEVDIPVTTSVGTACLAAADEGVEALLARADAALYRAKERGRNRVETA